MRGALKELGGQVIDSDIHGKGRKTVGSLLFLATTDGRPAVWAARLDRTNVFDGLWAYSALELTHHALGRIHQRLHTASLADIAEALRAGLKGGLWLREVPDYGDARIALPGGFLVVRDRVAVTFILNRELARAA
jgi:hypothetical protein